MSPEKILGCDGSHRKGRIGYAVVNSTGETLFRTGEKGGTSQTAELKALITALEYVPEGRESSEWEIHSDSAYALGIIIHGWYQVWEHTDFIGSSGKPVANQPLVKELIALWKDRPKVKLIKVAGHSGNPLNDHADREASAGRVVLEKESLRWRKRCGRLKK